MTDIYGFLNEKPGKINWNYFYDDGLGKVVIDTQKTFKTKLLEDTPLSNPPVLLPRIRKKLDKISMLDMATYLCEKLDDYDILSYKSEFINNGKKYILEIRSEDINE